jgi:hypothetical protein
VGVPFFLKEGFSLIGSVYSTRCNRFFTKKKNFRLRQTGGTGRHLTLSDGQSRIRHKVVVDRLGLEVASPGLFLPKHIRPLPMTRPKSHRRTDSSSLDLAASASIAVRSDAANVKAKVELSRADDARQLTWEACDEKFNRSLWCLLKCPKSAAEKSGR